MKNTTLTLLLFAITGLLCAQQERPEWVNVSPFSEDYDGSIDGTFVNKNEGWIWQVSRYMAHKLYYTNDGAETFNLIHTLEDSTLRFSWLQMFDSKNGYCKTNTNHLLKTSDGGANWSTVTINPNFIENLEYPFEYSIYFYNNLIGFSEQWTDTGMVIFKTIDGGYNWQPSEIRGIEKYRIHRMELGWVDKYFFYDELHGWANMYIPSGMGVCLATVDGGLTWDVAVYGVPFYDVEFISPDIGGIVGGNFTGWVQLTNNNFENLYYDNQDWGPNHYQLPMTISFQNDTIIWISGKPDVLFKSIDQGVSFEVYDSEIVPDNGIVKDIQFFNQKYGYAFGFPNLLQKYIDTLPEVIGVKCIINNELEIYPNPVKDYLNINFNQAIKGKLSVYNKLGQQFFYESLHNVKKTNIDVSLFPKGIYFLSFYNKHQNHTEKFIVR